MQALPSVLRRCSCSGLLRMVDTLFLAGFLAGIVKIDASCLLTFCCYARINTATFITLAAFCCCCVSPLWRSPSFNYPCRLAMDSFMVRLREVLAYHSHQNRHLCCSVCSVRCFQHTPCLQHRSTRTPSVGRAYQSCSAKLSLRRLCAGVVSGGIAAVF